MYLFMFVFVYILCLELKEKGVHLKIIKISKFILFRKN